MFFYNFEEREVAQELGQLRTGSVVSRRAIGAYVNQEQVVWYLTMLQRLISRLVFGWSPHVGSPTCGTGMWS